MSKNKLPNQLIKFKSSDKNWHQEPDYEDLANCCSPVFCIITGNVNCGKSSLLKNLLVHKKPNYERIVVYSPLGEESNEYTDDLDCEMINEIPDFEYFDKEIRNCFIIEDTDTKSLPKDERYKLGRFFGVYASHNNIDVYCITQNVYDLMPQIRRLCNICFLFRNHDIESMTSLARKFNIKQQDLKHIFNYMMQSKFDSLCIDETRDPEHRLRLNIFEKIKI
jgi:ABC-type cobalamin/Fe3+-siderophores transport system ATPase subunit